MYTRRSSERLKARLVAQDYSQISGPGFDEAFTPVKPTTISVIWSIAVTNKWVIHQLVVKNAFLHGFPKETVFLEQPPGFIDKTFSNHLFRFNRALNGLKQAPQAWFECLTIFSAWAWFF